MREDAAPYSASGLGVMSERKCEMLNLKELMVLMELMEFRLMAATMIPASKEATREYDTKSLDMYKSA